MPKVNRTIDPKDRERSRAWCFTMFQYTDDDIERLKEFASSERVVRCVVGREHTKDGRPHLQGYVRLEQPARLAYWKTLLPKAHFEVRRSHEEAPASSYCKKEGDVVIDKGVDKDDPLPKMGKDEEAYVIIGEIERGETYGRIRNRHKLFCFWNRRFVLDFKRDEEWLRDHPDVDPC